MEVETGTTYVRDLAVLADGTVAVDASRADAPADILLVHLPTGATRAAAVERTSPVPEGLAAVVAKMMAKRGSCVENSGASCENARCSA